MCNTCFPRLTAQMCTKQAHHFVITYAEMLRLEPTVIRLTLCEVNDLHRRSKAQQQLHPLARHDLGALSVPLRQPQYSTPYSNCMDLPRLLYSSIPTGTASPEVLVEDTSDDIDGANGQGFDPLSRTEGVESSPRSGWHSNMASACDGPSNSLNTMPRPSVPFPSMGQASSSLVQSMSQPQPAALRGVGPREPSRVYASHSSPVTMRMGFGGPRDVHGSPRLIVYNDSVTAMIQSQARHLPEARHQSRLHESYTAPSGRYLFQGPATTALGRHRRRARAASPFDTGIPGLVRLYGGMENPGELAPYDAATRRHWAGQRRG